MNCCSNLKRSVFLSFLVYREATLCLGLVSILIWFSSLSQTNVYWCLVKCMGEPQVYSWFLSISQVMANNCEQWFVVTMQADKSRPTPHKIMCRFMCWPCENFQCILPWSTPCPEEPLISEPVSILNIVYDLILVYSEYIFSIVNLYILDCKYQWNDLWFFSILVQAWEE